MVNYPAGHKPVQTRANTTKYGNRGMSLEEDINLSNQYYLDSERAVVHKKPTPIQIVTVDYQSRSSAKITEAYFGKPSTTDYNGVYRGLPLDFEAKETHSRTSFPLSKIQAHQLRHLQQVLKQQAIAFVLIRFTVYEETYYVEAQKILSVVKNGQKSLNRSWMQENGCLIPYALNVPVDYLNVIDRLCFKGE